MPLDLFTDKKEPLDLFEKEKPLDLFEDEPVKPFRPKPTGFDVLGAQEALLSRDQPLGVSPRRMGRIADVATLGQFSAVKKFGQAVKGALPALAKPLPEELQPENVKQTGDIFRAKLKKFLGIQEAKELIAKPIKTAVEIATSPLRVAVDTTEIDNQITAINRFMADNILEIGTDPETWIILGLQASAAASRGIGNIIGRTKSMDSARKILNVSRGANLKQIKSAYRKQAAKGIYRHRDAGGSDESFKKLVEARDTLINENGFNKVYNKVLKPFQSFAEKLRRKPIQKFTKIELQNSLVEFNKNRPIVNMVKPISETNAVDMLTDAIIKAKTGRRELEKAFTIEKGQRVKKGLAALEIKGEAGFVKALGELKGELAPEKKHFEGLRNVLTQEKIDELSNIINATPDLDFFEKMVPFNGLNNIIEGRIPPQSQLRALEDIFGKDLVKALETKKPFINKVGNLATEILNVPRAFMTSGEMSAVLRQSVIFTVTHPVLAIKSGKEMFRQAFSKKIYDQWFTDLKNDPARKLMKDSNLYIANPDQIAGGLSQKEERFMTSFAQKIPIAGQIVTISERGFHGYLNKMRVDLFKQFSAKMIEDGYDPKENIKPFRDLADWIGNGTGRGSLGKFNVAAQTLNTIFFSPRLIASRFNLLMNPVFYARLAPPVRKEALKTIAGFIGIGATVLAISKINGAETELDFRSSDAGKIKVGKVRWDIWGGFQQWVRVFTQLATGHRKSITTGKVFKLSGKEFPFETRLDVIERFARGKLAPIPALALELIEGQKLYGGELKASRETMEKTIPLYIQDIIEAMNDLGPIALFTVGVPAFFGVGIQTLTPRKKKTL